MATRLVVGSVVVDPAHRRGRAHAGVGEILRLRIPRLRRDERDLTRRGCLLHGHDAAVQGDLEDPRALDTALGLLFVLLDDAHGFGVLGATGAGVLQHFGVASERIIYMATLGKAAGVFGAFVAGASALIEWLLQRARPYVYTTSTPPMLAHALLKSIEIIAAEGERRASLAQLVARLKQGCAGLPWHLLPSHMAIQPLVVGATDAAMRVAEAARPNVSAPSALRSSAAATLARTMNSSIRRVALLRRLGMTSIG